MNIELLADFFEQKAADLFSKAEALRSASTDELTIKVFPETSSVDEMHESGGTISYSGEYILILKGRIKHSASLTEEAYKELLPLFARGKKKTEVKTMKSRFAGFYDSVTDDQVGSIDFDTYTFSGTKGPGNFNNVLDTLLTLVEGVDIDWAPGKGAPKAIVNKMRVEEDLSVSTGASVTTMFIQSGYPHEFDRPFISALNKTLKWFVRLDGKKTSNAQGGPGRPQIRKRTPKGTSLVFVAVARDKKEANKIKVEGKKIEALYKKRVARSPISKKKAEKMLHDSAIDAVGGVTIRTTPARTYNSVKPLKPYLPSRGTIKTASKTFEGLVDWYWG